jgi:hypothetical protein
VRRDEMRESNDRERRRTGRDDGGKERRDARQSEFFNAFLIPDLLCRHALL